MNSPPNPDMMMSAAPTITSVSPPRIPSGGGMAIVRGTGFRSGLSATIDGIPAPATLVSATEAQLSAPARPGRFGPVEVVLRNTDGQTARDAKQLNYFLGTIEFKAGAMQAGVTRGVPLVRDVDNDGKADVVMPGGTSLHVFKGDGNGGLASPKMYPVCRPGGFILGDYTGDKIQDVVVTCFDDQTIMVLPGKSDGSFGTGITTTTTTRPQALASGDINKDGKLDLLVSHGSQNQTALWILPGKGDGTFGTAIKLPVTDQATAPEFNQPSAGLVDFNRDGNLDAYVCLIQYNKIGIFLGRGDGTFGSMTSLPSKKSPIFSDAGDINQDGAPDLVISETNNNSVGVYLGKGDGTFLDRQDYTMGFNDARLLQIVDLNKDGLADVAMVNYAGTTLSLLLGNGDGTFSLSQVAPTIPLNTLSFTIGDLTGDQLPEVVVSPFSGGLSVLNNASR